MTARIDEWEDLEERWYIVVAELESMIQSCLMRLVTADTIDAVRDFQGEIRGLRMLKQLPANKVRELQKREGATNGRRRRG